MGSALCWPNRVAEALDSMECREGRTVPASHASCGIAGTEAGVLGDLCSLSLLPLGFMHTGRELAKAWEAVCCDGIGSTLVTAGPFLYPSGFLFVK